MYKIRIEKRVYRDLDKIPTHDLDKIYQAITRLETGPRPMDSHKLTGWADRYRIRQGHYRIIYTINDKAKTVSVMFVRHRKDIYRNQ